MAKLVSKVYGDALFEAAQETKCLDETFEQVLALQEILKEHEDLIQLLNHPHKKIGIAYVTSAVPLSEDQKAQVTERLLTTTRYVEFEMNYEVDPSLIGGMIIRIGDRVVDSSIKTQLYELKRQLLDVQLA